ncbi:MAG: hypothetical protein V4549_18030 [Bacteroidota bacterium]
METTLAVIDPKEFGLEQSKANEILIRFEHLQVKMAELEPEFVEVKAMDINDPIAELKAKELGKKYMKIRTERAKIHKEEKAFFLNAGRFVDRIKNDADKSTTEREDALEAIEKHHANIEIDRKNKLAQARIDKLKEFEFDGSQLNLGTMDDNVWISFLSGTEMAFKAKKEDERLAQVSKEEAEKAAIIERERVEEENKQLKIEADRKEKELEIERKKQAEIIAEQKRINDIEIAKQEAFRKSEQEKSDAILEAQRKQAAKDKLIADEKLKKEREANKRLQDELQAKQDAEKKAESIKQAEIKAKEAEEKRLAKAPEKEKFLKAINDLNLQLNSTDFTTQNIAISINAKFEGFKNWAIEQANTI